MQWEDLFYNRVAGSNLLLSSQTEKLIAATKFSDYLGLKDYKKEKKTAAS